MYHHVTGKLVDLSPTRAVLEAAGVGFELFIPFSTYRRVNHASDDGSTPREVSLLTHLLVREEIFRLYGFATEPERQVFRTVLGVSGLGPSTALTILSSLDVEDFQAIVNAGDPKPLQRVKGIGKKLAGRLILELRDRLEILPSEDGDGARGDPAATVGLPRGDLVSSEAILALVELGFPQPEAESRVGSVVESLRAAAAGESDGSSGDGNGAGAGNGDAITVETVLHRALRQGR